MLRLDGHIHIQDVTVDNKIMMQHMEEVGISGGIVLSKPPCWLEESNLSFQQRVDQVLSFCDGEIYLFPFFFIDPLEKDALKQIDYAVENGIRGFKIICGRHYPSHPDCIETCKKIAENDKPLLFHSGILWDGINNSGNYNKPTEFEILLQINKLKFSLAHISWPWTDECIAVYGKFNEATILGKKTAAEMFIDTTPGTPPIYRKSALERLLLTGYNINDNVIFGLDNYTDSYDVKWAKENMDRDDKIYDELNIPTETRKKIYSENLLRFVNEK